MKGKIRFTVGILSFAFVFSQILFLFVSNAHAVTCEQTCSQATESGINQAEDSGQTINCCCIDQGGQMENRPESECQFD